MFPDKLEGHITDLGDVLLQRRIIIKGSRPRPIFRVGAPREKTDHPDPPEVPITENPTGKVDLRMDIMSDQEVDLSIEWTDEHGNPTDAPADATVSWTVDDPALIELIDNGDGTTVAGALGTLGTANVHMSATAAGRETTGDLQMVVVAGLAERANIKAGEPRERTPDTE